MLSGKYKEIVESFYTEPKKEVIVSSFIEENDSDKDENSIGLPMKRRKIDSKGTTKDVTAFFTIAEKRGNGENEQVQENAPVDIIEID